MGQGLCCADNSQTTGNFYSMNIENQRYGRKRPDEIGRNHFNRKFSERELSPEARVVRDYRKQVRRPMLRGQKTLPHVHTEDALSNLTNNANNTNDLTSLNNFSDKTTHLCFNIYLPETVDIETKKSRR